MNDQRPLVGLLYNPAVPHILYEAGDLVQYLEIIPERFWYDLGPGAAGDRPRFDRLNPAIEAFMHYVRDRTVSAHGIGLSLPSAIPLDEELLDQITSLSEEIPFAWYSEHLSLFLTPNASVPNAQAGLGLPVVYCEETFAILRDKLSRLQAKLKCPLMLENGSIFTPIPQMEMTEPEFLNRLYAELGCGALLDLHNLYVTYRNGGATPDEYLRSLNPEAIFEIHLAGGDELNGFYTDSHSRFTPEEVWSWAVDLAPSLTNLRAVTFEFHESYFERLGSKGIANELERMHRLVSNCPQQKGASCAG